MKLKGILFLLLSRNENTLTDVAYKTLEDAKQNFIDINIVENKKNLGVAQCCLAMGFLKYAVWKGIFPSKLEPKNKS